MFNPPTFFLEPEMWQEPFRLEKNEARHLSRVLRIRTGEKIRLIDGQGREGIFLVSSIKKNEVTLAKESLSVWPEPESKVHLALAWNKSFRRSWLLEKAVEIGVWKIVLWQARHSQGRTVNASMENWRGKMIAAAKQSRNPWIPELVFLHHGVEEITWYCRDIKNRILLWEKEEDTGLVEYYQSVSPLEKIIVVGPEGGLAGEEVQLLTKAGFISLSLGPRVLRWETAALAPLFLDMLFFPERSGDPFSRLSSGFSS